MRLSNSQIFLLFVFLQPFFLSYGTQLTITQPGAYQLGTNFLVTTTIPNDNAIVIASSNVWLDFNNHSISQVTTTTGFNGVVINAGIQDVAIWNGIIQNITGTGIVLSGSNSRIVISDMSLHGCGAGGLLANGLTGTINDLIVSNCQFNACGATFTNARVIDLENCQGSRINSCVLNNMINVGGTVTVITMSNCTACDLDTVSIENNLNSAGNFIAISQSFNRACSFKKVAVRSNSAAFALTGFLLSEVIGGVYSKCSCIGNSSTTGAFNGFSIVNTSSGFNIFDQCTVISNGSSSSTANAGFSITGTGNIFVKCVSNGMIAAGTGDGYGFINTGSGAQTYVECIACYNTTTGGGIVAGIEETSASNSLLTKCTINRNIGTNTATNTFGYLSNIASAPILLTNNVAFNNGTTSANQFFNVAANATSLFGTSNINSAGNAAWSNLGINA